MEFIPLYFGDRLKVINPHGTIGVVTLWSKIDYVVERFRQAGVDLNPATSPIAVFGNLYGNGLREMLRNLLYNPQIQVLLICGNDRSGSKEELEKFFQLGLTPLGKSFVNYRQPANGVIVTPVKIRETNRTIDDLVNPELFSPVLEILWIGDPSEDKILVKIEAVVATMESLVKVHPQQFEESMRLQVPLPEVQLKYFPSNPRAHVIVLDTPLEAWKELIFMLTKFGHRVTLRKGERLELQNVKVVVEKPQIEPKYKLESYDFDIKKLKKYQRDIIVSSYKPRKTKGQEMFPYISRIGLRADDTYSYGNRLRHHFGIDALLACVERLKKDHEDRKAYFTLWDNKQDLHPESESGHPCFVSLFFRKFEELLTLTATFRTHNALDGWLLNCYGLIAIQKWVAKKVGMDIGAITVISHSISIDPRELDRAMLIIGKRPFKVRLDPMGYFRITLDGRDILVEHRYEDVTLREYRGRKAERLQHEIARDVALSDLNHAIYLGRQLARAELALKEGREFIQD